MELNDFKLIWVFQGAFLCGMFIVVFLMLFKLRKAFNRITMLSIYLFVLSHVLLTGIDVYTIVYENYSVYSVKAAFMLFAFFCSDLALLLLLSATMKRETIG